MSTSRSRGSDITLIVDDFALRRTSSIVSVLDSLNGSPTRWSDPISRIVCGARPPGTLIALDWIALLNEMSLTRFCTCSSPATAVVAATAPVMMHAAAGTDPPARGCCGGGTASRQPTFDRGQALRWPPLASARACASQSGSARTNPASACR